MRKLACGAIALVLATAGFAATDPFKDPLDLPAAMLKRQITTTQMTGITHAGTCAWKCSVSSLLVRRPSNCFCQVLPPKVETGVTSTISAGAVMADGEVLLVTVTGQMVASKDGGEHFQMIPVAHPMSFAGIAAAGPGSAVVVGSGGVSTITLR